MIEKGALVPNAEIVSLDGAVKRLWDYRQKCHVLLIVGERVQVTAVAQRLAARQKLLAWLGLELAPAANRPEGFPDGAHAVDRYGELIESYPLDDGLMDRLEKDLIYYEACRCG